MKEKGRGTDKSVRCPIENWSTSAENMLECLEFHAAPAGWQTTRLEDAAGGGGPYLVLVVRSALVWKKRSVGVVGYCSPTKAQSPHHTGYAERLACRW